ncbi:unnamed protein product [Phyllotreta striolata]|uniref:non-specific serine/threonine protein kinase n=1 Tax=Phyllotreta striolata TaxID=444603 RepID=A0A9N9XJ65_PHYSR|nr:unnamed protein product [Phyllotreta striolata]
MEHHKEPISVRIARINSEISGACSKINKSNTLLARETLLDILQVLYEECCSESLQKYDPNITKFVQKYKETMKDIKRLRVNITDFEIRNVIGRGHFGEVHLVKEKQTGDVYAMKSIRKFDSDLSKISFEEEKNIMAFSNSNWLVSLQYAFQDSTYLVFVTEYLPGGDLLGLLYRQGGTIPESAATFYLAELLVALDDLHKMGYVHRDIKPDNILLDRCGHIKLADFGSAAKLNDKGLVTEGPPVGTPYYIAPEVLQSLNGQNSAYGISCDFWSLGVLAYELTIGNTPFTGATTSSVYSKIMNHSKSLKFPPDLVITQAYVSLIKKLLTDVNSRLDSKRIKEHSLFKSTCFDSLREQVPPFVPKITSEEDTSNFTDVTAKKNNPNVDSFKKRTHFSGRNLPFVGFTYVQDSICVENASERKILNKDVFLEGLKKEIETLRNDLITSQNLIKSKENTELKYEEISRKLENTQSLRDRLERELGLSIAENTALKRTLEIERKDRTELEKKALDIIKSAKLKWETSEKTKTESLTLEIEQQKVKISELTMTIDVLNQQLQRALQLQKHGKESLEKVESLSRRSVIGLESRLDEITNETQTVIAELQKKLTDELHKRNVLENKLSNAEEKEKNLIEKLKNRDSDLDYWKSKTNDLERQMKLLNNRAIALENDVKSIDDYKEEISKLRDQIDEDRRSIKDLENRNVSLQRDSRFTEECKKEMEEMKKTLSMMQNDKKLSELESRLAEEREKCSTLRQRLEESECAVTENQELKQLRTKLWRAEKDLSNAKIDRRILERELKDAREEMKQLTEQTKTIEEDLAQSRKANEAALLELNGINENLSLELIKTKDSYKNLQEKLSSEKEKLEIEKSVISELRDMTKTKDSQINSLIVDLSGLKKERNNLENELKSSQSEKDKLTGFVELLQKEKREIQDEWDKTKRELQNTNLNLHALREACTLLENQVIEYEKINASYEAKQASLNGNTEKLIRDLCEAKSETQEAKKRINEEKSANILAESKIKRLNEDVARLNEECQNYRQQCFDFKQFSTGLSDELAVAEEKISDLDVTVKTYQRQIDDLRSELRQLKQEASDYLTQLNKSKESNYKMRRQLGEEKEENVALSQHLSETRRILMEKTNYYKERELKSEATIKQQIKLIDYLQTKIDEHTNKKKTFTEVLFGSSKKENQPPVSMVMNYKDLESQLSKERQINKNLQEEIFKLKLNLQGKDAVAVKSKVERHKSEILSPKNKIVTKDSEQKFYRQSSLNRMHHNIPHRFESKISYSSTKCAGCSEAVSLGRIVAICTECNVYTHVDCKNRMPNTCGLPEVYAKHFMDNSKQDDVRSITNQSNDENVNIQGWIKVLGSTNCWEKQYAIMTDNSLRLYTSPPKERSCTLLRTLELRPSNGTGKVVSEPLPSEIGVPTAESDLPFVLKIEFSDNESNLPTDRLVFLTLSAQDKDAWFAALQKIYYDDVDRPKCETILTVEEPLRIVCVADLTDGLKLLGTESGLYSYYENKLIRIDGIDKVHHVAVMSMINQIIMIVDEERRLIKCDINHYINITQCAHCVKPTLKYNEVDVSNLSGFHFLKVSTFKNQEKFCAATLRQLVIVNFDSLNGEFTTVKILDTAEPTTCALFTENSLIVGADKFFEVDLVTFQAEEFLDASDVKLRATESCYKMGSFPMAVMQVCTNPKEYLLCYKEFSIFVDEYGRSSRQREWKSHRLPSAFHYTKPYLYVSQFSGIEVFKITDETCNGAEEKTESYRIEMDPFDYLGSNKRGIYIGIKNEVKFVDASELPPFEDSSLVSETSDNVSEDRFTFSSSIVQSLDGNSSGSEVAEERQRKVTFSLIK